MISTKSLLYNIDLKLNKVATLVNQEIPVWDKIVALNEAQNKLIIVKMDPNNTLNQGFEGFKKRYEDLQILVEPAHKHPLKLKLVDKRQNKWEADISTLTPKYMFYIDGYCLADKDTCKNRVLTINKDLVRHADIATLLANNNYKPSFEYQEVPGTLTSNKLEVYSDGTFTYSLLYLNYIRYPKKIDISGYINLDGNESVDSDCELPEYLLNELVSLAVLELGFDTENTPAVNATQDRIKTIE